MSALTPGAGVVELFSELVAIPSPSGRERRVGEAIRDWLSAAGVASGFDGAGAVNDSDAGNLIAHIPGAPGAPRLLFVAHVDTVEGGSPPVSPRLDADGIIRSAGDTILGADNKSAVAAVMRLCAAVAAMPEGERPPVTAAFTCREESGRMGASLLALPRTVDCAFSVDGSRPIGTVITRALGQTAFVLEVRGRRAHAAANPEAGVSAIRAACEIVAAAPHGRLPGGGSAGIAALVGGSVVDRLAPAALRALGVGDDAPGRDAATIALAGAPTNSVPDLALLRGEVRGYSRAEMEAAVASIRAIADRVCASHGAEYAWISNRDRVVPPFPGSPDSRARALVRAAAARVDGATYAEEEAQATLEANYLAADTDVVAVASGGRDPHQTSESISVDELRALEALLLEIVREAAGAAPR